MNRMGRNNLVQDISLSVDFQSKKPYLLFRDKSRPEQGTYGVWFHDEADLKCIGHALKRILKEAMEGERELAAPAAAPADPGRALLTMLRAPGAATPAPAPAPAPLHTPAQPAPAGLSAPAMDASSAAPSLQALLGIGAKNAHNAASGGLAAAPRAELAVAPTPAPAPVPAPVHAPVPAPATAAATAAAAGLLGGLSAAAAAGELNVFLTRRQLQTALLEMLQEDEFVKALHKQYMTTAMRMAEEREGQRG